MDFPKLIKDKVNFYLNRLNRKISAGAYHNLVLDG